MVDLWNHHPLRVVALLLPAIYVVGRTGQLLLQYRKIKREGLRGNFLAQIIVGILFSFLALVLCKPEFFGLTLKEVGLESPEDDGTAQVVSAAHTKGPQLPSEVRFKGPLVPARDAILKEDWSSLAKIIFDVRATSGEFARDTDFLLRNYSQQLGKQYLTMGQAALERGDAVMARKYLDYATDLVPEEPEGFLLRAAAAPAEEWRSALKDLDVAIRRSKPGDPRLVQATEKRLALRLSHGDGRGALEDVDVLLSLHPEDTARLAQRGQLRLAAGAVNGAIADLSSASSSAPTDMGLRIELANARLNKKEDGESAKLALADLTKAITGGMDTARARLLRGQAHFTLKHSPDALADFSKAIALDPKNADAFYYRGQVKLVLDQTNGAKSDFTQAITINPDHPKALYARGLITKDREPKSALVDFGRAYELEADPRAMFYKGECLLALGRREEAETAYTDALTIAKDPKLIDMINKSLLRAKNPPPRKR